MDTSDSRQGRGAKLRGEEKEKDKKGKGAWEGLIQFEI